MRRHFFLTMIVALIGVPCPLVSEGAILTYVTQGRVTQITDPLGLLDFVHLDDMVTYRATFETTLPGSHPFPGYSAYTGVSSSVQVGAIGLSGHSPTMAIAHPLDFVDVESHADLTIPGLDPTAFIQMVLYDQVENNALENTALPSVPYDLSRFASAYHQITFRAPPAQPGGYPIDLWVAATVDSFHIIPEPSCFVLFAGAELLATRKRSCCLSGESSHRRG